MTSPTAHFLKPLNVELAHLQGKRVFFEPLEGNNGDHLIEMGSLTLLNSIDAKLVSNPRQADAIDTENGYCLNLIRTARVKMD